MSKILIVDDESGIRNFCYDLFTREGFEVVTVACGEQLFDVLKTEKPDLVLMDILIPGEEGLSLLRRMPNEKDKRIPVIVFSGYVTPEIEKEAYEAGAVEVLKKDITLHELRDKVKKIISAGPRLFRGPEDKTRKEKILVVDDEETVRRFLSEFFERKGFEVLAVASGEEAIQAVRDEKPAMVLLDIVMPGMDGIVTLRKIREIDPKVGVVMATGLQDEMLARDATQLGAYAYVVKPFDLKYLELVVLTRLVISA
ncbi:MAG: response regulator [Candidatus Omnitrophica bacterium]|nr:response regulator [Candidatus Omnitrophota bacterium]